MNWQQIIEDLAEINDIYNEIIAKFEGEDIEKIYVRNDKYTKNQNIKTRDGIQDNQLNVLPYQMIILYKVMGFLKTNPIQNIYPKMPTDLNEAIIYTQNLKKEAQLTLNSVKMVIDIEKLAKTEYRAPNYFQDTEYAKKVYFENSLFVNYFLNAPTDQYEICSRIMKTKLDEYLEKLTLEQKRTLIIETLALSYDRNAFKYLNIYKLFGSMHINSQLEDKMYEEYLSFKKNLKTIELTNFENKELSEIYDELKIIYESDFLREKVLKK